MESSELKLVLKEIIGRFHAEGPPQIFERDLELPEFHKANKVFVVIGPRRAGKTFVLYQIMHRLLKEGTPLQDLLYLNLENERLSGITAGQLGLILEDYEELYPGKKPVYFLDEIQNVTGWEKFVRRLNDEGYKVYISGSNSKLLSREIATSLRGRDYPIQVMPLSFKEFLKVRGVELKKNWEFDGTKNTVKKLFDEYMNLSGFPEIVIEKKLEFVDTYFKTMLYQDAIERFKIGNTGLFRLLMKNMTRQYGQEYSINKFNNFAKSNAYKSSTSVVQKYSKVLEDIYFSFLVNAKQKSFKKESGYIKKAYVCDQGFINYYDPEKDPGRILENIVFLELFRRKKETYYYKNGFECDFITNDACIQVCHTLTEKDRKREINGLEEAAGKFKRKMILLTYDQEKQVSQKIRAVPVWKWMLEK